MEFTLFVAEHEGNVYVLADVSDEVRAALGDALQTHTFTLKAPLQERHRQEYDRITWRTGVYDDSMAWAAAAVAYLQAWTLPQPLTLEGFASLHPSASRAVGVNTLKHVFPNLGDSPFFMSLLNARQPMSTEPA